MPQDREEGIFLPLEELQLPLSRTRNGHKIAVCTSIFGGYDSSPVKVPQELIDHPDVSFFVFTDEHLKGPVAPWTFVRTPYWKLDKEVDQGWKNSFSNIDNEKKRNNLKAKYYKFFAWRLPELRDYRYIVYVDGNVVLEKAKELYERTTKLFLQMPKITMFMMLHPWNKDVTVETSAAMQQLRYVKDGVQNQTALYLENYRFPYKKYPVYLTTFVVYDTQNMRQRALNWAVFDESQLWTMEDQIGLSFLVWRHKMQKQVKGITDMCTDLFQVPPKERPNKDVFMCVYEHTVKYGSDYGKE